MEVLQEIKESNTTVVLDGKHFVNCAFTNCTFLYSGGDFGWNNSKFVDCKLTLLGSAQRTANLMGHFGMLRVGVAVSKEPEHISRIGVS